MSKYQQTDPRANPAKSSIYVPQCYLDALRFVGQALGNKRGPILLNNQRMQILSISRSEILTETCEIGIALHYRKLKRGDKKAAEHLKSLIPEHLWERCEASFQANITAINQAIADWVPPPRPDNFASLNPVERARWILENEKIDD